MEAKQSCSKISGAAAAEWIENEITWSSALFKDVERKLNWEHCKIGADSIECQRRRIRSHCLAFTSYVHRACRVPKGLPIRSVDSDQGFPDKLISQFISIVELWGQL